MKNSDVEAKKAYVEVLLNKGNTKVLQYIIAHINCFSYLCN
ncbi:MAG: hypothetical protein ACOCVF_03770 [bacterium]